MWINTNQSDWELGKRHRQVGFIGIGILIVATRGILNEDCVTIDCNKVNYLNIFIINAQQEFALKQIA